MGACAVDQPADQFDGSGHVEVVPVDAAVDVESHQGPAEISTGPTGQGDTDFRPGCQANSSAELDGLGVARCYVIHLPQDPLKHDTRGADRDAKLIDPKREVIELTTDESEPRVDDDPPGHQQLAVTSDGVLLGIDRQRDLLDLPNSGHKNEIRDRHVADYYGPRAAELDHERVNATIKGGIIAP